MSYVELVDVLWRST